MSMKVAKRSMSSGPPVSAVTGVLLFVLILLLAPTAASAAEMAGTSNTYLQSRESVADDKLLPVYEYIDFVVHDLGSESVSVHFGGWLGYDLQDDSFGQGKDKDRSVQYGYVSYRTKEHNAVVNLGRVMVFEGVAAERLDGVYARTDIKGGFGISVFGGTSSIIAEEPKDETIYGGRLSHQSADLYTIGASYLKSDSNNQTFRQEGGIDLSLQPVNKVAVTGRSSYNFQTTGWMEHAYYLMFGPFDKLRVNAEATWISYEDYFASTTSSVFRMTPGGLLDPNEKVKMLGPEIFYAITGNFAVSADYKKYGYDIAGSANYFGGKATYALPKSYNAGLSVHKMDGETSRLKYDEYRIYAAKKINKTNIAVDLLAVKYKEAINDVTSAYSATLAAGYELTEKLKLGLDVEYSKTPDFDKDVRLFAKVVYNFDFTSGSQKPAALSVPEQSVPRAASEPVTTIAAAPVLAGPSAPVEQVGTPGGAEQDKLKEGN